MKKELTFRRSDSYGGEIMDCGGHLLVCFYFVANGWMDGWMDEKGASFFRFGYICLTLLKLRMDGKEIDLLFLSCSVPLDEKGLDFCLIVQLLFCSCSIQRMVEES